MAPTRLPASIRIGPYQWAIVVDADEWEKQKDSDEANAICDTEHIRILIKPECMKADQVRLRMYVVHEILHACFFTAHADIDTRDEDKAEESLITVTAPMLLQVMRDNPKLLVWLVA